VQTLGKPPLKTNDFAAGYVPNCEGWVSAGLPRENLRRDQIFGAQRGDQETSRVDWIGKPCGVRGTSNSTTSFTRNTVHRVSPNSPKISFFGV